MRILLVITGGIAAYKIPELVRLFKKNGHEVRCILTEAAKQFVSPFTLATLSEESVFDDLWSLKDETEIGHIRLSRECDIILVAPATANMIAKIANGLADDLASSTLLASDKPLYIAPAMNPMMWSNQATQENIQKLRSRDIYILGPESGSMACHEDGLGRMCDPETLYNLIITSTTENLPLSGLKAIVTAGPTFEPIDPVRFIGNRSSGKQGYAIARALVSSGAQVTLVTGPVNLEAPHGVNLINVETADQMYNAVMSTLPYDIAVCTAAVSDWRIKDRYEQKIKKQKSDKAPILEMTENPDILHAISTQKNRPDLVIGFAAETEDIIKNGQLKLTKKKCDWILANQVGGKEKTFHSDDNHVYFLSGNDVEDWTRQSKQDVAEKLIRKIITVFDHKHKNSI